MIIHHHHMILSWNVRIARRHSGCHHHRIEMPGLQRRRDGTFAETHVDIVFFLTGAKYHEVRLRGPLGMASVVNMATRMRGRFVRSSPKDRHLTCEELPTLYATP